MPSPFDSSSSISWKRIRCTRPPLQASNSELTTHNSPPAFFSTRHTLRRFASLTTFLLASEPNESSLRLVYVADAGRRASASASKEANARCWGVQARASPVVDTGRSYMVSRSDGFRHFIYRPQSYSLGRRSCDSRPDWKDALEGFLSFQERETAQREAEFIFLWPAVVVCRKRWERNRHGEGRDG
ncbi:hypothetical protein M427DRAFT_54406 [Gonapodya prolifera JEL478]|uniref:Uncharacterized protein n=1 Tax=Gonapodya prolifera (strain JEL478) TaxID=1344416 RepID=A0A139AMA3_GONPJ|nr:hypothetical protein M427DRAFT_54406 [Gonapodya prolifera JEL478]|eukprot:KXS17828.1 hypothetical protein M427DRAFT_54406 [Gonapodya prolifera JEL478]